MDRVVVIGNPRSGRGRGEALLNRVEAEVTARGHGVETLRTKSPGHAVDLARSCAGRVIDLVMAVGGDGTIRDVAAGLAEGRCAAPLGIVPAGTGNDLARTLQLPRDLSEAVEMALNGQDLAVDLWTWNRSVFINVAGLGLDAAVASLVNRRYRNLRGPLPYVLALLTLLPGFRSQEVRLRWPEGEWDGRIWLAAFGNGRYYGGGMEIAPSADPSDGLLDAVLVGDVSKLELLRELPGLFHGRHVRHPRVKVIRSDRFDLDAPDQEVTIDGELIDRAPAAIRKLSQTLRVRLPRGRR
jgi:YegS/Rv2252/BmrU family lipid kinase